MFSRAASLSRRAKPFCRANRETRYTTARKAPRARAENKRIFLRIVIEQLSSNLAGELWPSKSSTGAKYSRHTQSFSLKRLFRPPGFRGAHSALQDVELLGQRSKHSIADGFVQPHGGQLANFGNRLGGALWEGWRELVQ